MPGPSGVTLLQYYLLSLLLRYMFPQDDKKVDESTLLLSLEQLWASGKHEFRPALEPQFDGCHEALRIWIGLRRKTSELRSIIERRSSAQTLDLVDRALSMNEIRILHLQWKALRAPVDGQAMSPEDLLCITFAIMTKTRGTEALFKKGLDNLRDTTPGVWSSEDCHFDILLMACDPLNKALRGCTSVCCQCVSFRSSSYVLSSG
jgi:hypothetical protein